MAVDAPQIRIDPYTSTVPTVSIPPQEMDAQTRPAAPLQGEFGKKGTGALAIGDSIVKGLIQGHQYKEQKKAELANATIATADKDTADAYQQYQDALTQNKPSAETQTAYQNYRDTFNRGKEAKAKFVIPEKGQKSSGQKKDKGVKGAAEGMAGGIKEWFAANPHVIPSLAILSMQPKPPGASPQTTAQKAEIERQQQIAQGGQIELDNAKQAQSDRNTVAQYASLTPDEVNALPEDEKKKLAAAQSRLAPAKGKTQIWRDGSGNILVLPEGTQPPTGYTPYEKSPTNESVPNELLDAGAKALGKLNRSQLTFSEMNAILGMEARQKAQASGQTTYTYSTLDASGNRSTQTRKISDPISPEEQRIAAALGGQGSIQAPPSAPGGRTLAPGAITSPPARASGGGIGAPPQKATLTDANREKEWHQRSQKAESAKGKAYEDAANRYQSAIRAADSDLSASKIDQATYDQRVKDAENNRSSEQAAAEGVYNQESKSIASEQNKFALKGGNKPAEPTPPPGATIAYKDKSGVIKGWAVNGQYVSATPGR